MKFKYKPVDGLILYTLGGIFALGLFISLMSWANAVVEAEHTSHYIGY
jgi:hypothetical protein